MSTRRVQARSDGEEGEMERAGVAAGMSDRRKSSEQSYLASQLVASRGRGRGVVVEVVFITSSPASLSRSSRRR